MFSGGRSEAALGGSIGTRFSGYVVYDNATVESDGYIELPGQPPRPPLASWALYLYPHSQAYSAVGNFVVSAGAAIDVYDNEMYLQNAHTSEVVFEAGSLQAGEFGFLLYANGAGPGEPLHSTSLVGIPWSIENFPSTTIHWDLYDSAAQLDIYPVGTVDYLVREPAALGLLALVACVLLRPVK